MDDDASTIASNNPPKDNTKYDNSETPSRKRKHFKFEIYEDGQGTIPKKIHRRFHPRQWTLASFNFFTPTSDLTDPIEPSSTIDGFQPSPRNVPEFWPNFSVSSETFQSQHIWPAHPESVRSRVSERLRSTVSFLRNASGIGEVNVYMEDASHIVQSVVVGTALAGIASASRPESVVDWIAESVGNNFGALGSIARQ